MICEICGTILFDANISDEMICCINCGNKLFINKNAKQEYLEIPTWHPTKDVINGIIDMINQSGKYSQNVLDWLIQKLIQ